jgi:hypothetical protein
MCLVVLPDDVEHSALDELRRPGQPGALVSVDFETAQKVVPDWRRIGRRRAKSKAAGPADVVAAQECEISFNLSPLSR